MAIYVNKFILKHLFNPSKVAENGIDSGFVGRLVEAEKLGIFCRDDGWLTPLPLGEAGGEAHRREG